MQRFFGSKRSIVFFTAILSFFGAVFLFSHSVVAEEGENKDTEEIKDDIKSTEKKLQKEKKNLDGLSSDLKEINEDLIVTQESLAQTQKHIVATQETISRKEAEINRLEKVLEQQKDVLRGVVQLLYDTSQTPIAEVVFYGERVSRLLDESDHMLSVEEKVSLLIEDSFETKEKIQGERKDLDAVKKEKEQLLAVQDRQKKELLSDKKETQSDIVETQATIEELQKKLAELQSDLNTLTGKSFNAKDIREAVEFASDETGVPKGVLYGFLKMETNLGANMGQCTYKEVEKVSVARYKKYGSKYKASINLLYTRRDIFYDIVEDLGYNKEKKVSCSPSGYIGQGGAMGVSQFMSDVWRGYEAEVRSKTGHNKPDPWNLADGVMALALKVRKAGATSDDSTAIRRAARNYLGADNKRYSDGIIYWSKNYKTLFN